MQISKETEAVVVSGFHSRMEKNVLKILLQEKCGIIIVLARGMYRKIPAKYIDAMKQLRILFISFEKDSVTKVSEYSAHKRNEHIKNLADGFPLLQNHNN